MCAADILQFWFHEITPTQWFRREAQFDALLRERFADVHHAATFGELFSWRMTAEGRLAEIIVLDQFTRNLYRDTPQAFACDLAALILAQEAVANGLDSQLLPVQRAFLYMPYMHSESKQVHAEGLPLFERLGQPETLEYERRHKAIIDRFGRYPHRNAVMGRASTDEEILFLAQPGSSF